MRLVGWCGDTIAVTDGGMLRFRCDSRTRLTEPIFRLNVIPGVIPTSHVSGTNVIYVKRCRNCDDIAVRIGAVGKVGNRLGI